MRRGSREVLRLCVTGGDYFVVFGGCGLGEMQVVRISGGGGNASVTGE